MKVEKVVVEPVYKLELSKREFDDIKNVFFWSRNDLDYSASEQARYEEIFKTFNSNA